MMSDLYASFNRHHSRTVWMDVRSAELTKYAANAMLAARFSFMNEIANLADVLGADVDHIRRGIGADTRIGHSFLYAGTGYGGSCFPKDTQALVSTAKSYGQSMAVVSATEQVNERQKLILVERLVQRMGEDLTGRKIAIWGLAFKPNTDDMREAPSRAVIRQLLKRGAHVTAYDPVASHEAMKALRLDFEGEEHELERFELAANDMQALEGADAVMALRIQRERLDGGEVSSFEAYRQEWGLSEERVAAHAARGCVVLHPGPMNEGVEIHPDLADGPRSLILEQVAEGIPIRMAAIWKVLRGDAPLTAPVATRKLNA
jgi:nucleotide sugar dehydrogenase